MKQCLEKFSRTAVYMPKRMIAATGVICYLVAGFGQVAAAGFTVGKAVGQKDESSALAVREQQKIVGINQVAEKPDRSGLIPDSDKNFDNGNRPQKPDAERVKSAAPANIAANQPAAECRNNDKRDIVAEPNEKRFQKLEKDIHHTFLLSVCLIFVAWVFCRK